MNKVAKALSLGLGYDLQGLLQKAALLPGTPGKEAARLLLEYPDRQEILPLSEEEVKEVLSLLTKEWLVA